MKLYISPDVLERELTIDERIQVLKESLRNLKEKFLRYCHEQGCENFTTCPEDCNCKKNLGLDTAISWRLSRICTFVLSNLSIDTYLFTFFDIQTIVFYHKDTYPILFENIRCVVDILQELGECIEEQETKT